MSLHSVNQGMTKALEFLKKMETIGVGNSCLWCHNVVNYNGNYLHGHDPDCELCSAISGLEHELVELKELR